MPYTVPERFLVAFSFAGEQRPLVKLIAQAVESRLGENTVFYADWYEHIIAGHDGDLVLQDIYANRARMIVVCVSEHYGNKAWTQIEHEAIRALNMQLRGSGHSQDRLRILPLRVGDGEVPGIPINAICPDARRKTVAETAQLILNRLAEIVALPGAASENADAPAATPIAEIRYDMGPMAASNPWYVERKVDQQLFSFLKRGGRTAALLGAPQMGKSSLSIRTEERMQELGYRLVRLNIRDDFATADFAGEGPFFTALTRAVAEGLHLDQPAADRFEGQTAPAELGTFFVGDVLPAIGGKVLVIFDHLDYLFHQPCGTQSLSGLRALHNMTANPPLDNLRLLLIHSLRPRPHDGEGGSVIDIARRFEVEDFTLEELRHLNSLHGNLLPAEQVPAIHQLLGGHPALTREAWNTMADQGLGSADLLAMAAGDGGPFSNHLRRILADFRRPENSELAEPFRRVIDGKGCPSEEVFERLLMIGVIHGTWHGDAAVRCGLYASWFPRRLPR